MYNKKYNSIHYWFENIKNKEKTKVENAWCFIFVCLFASRRIEKYVIVKYLIIRAMEQSLNVPLEIYSGAASHQLSATALLGSPDGSRHPLDVCEFTEEDYRHQNSNGNTHYQNGRSGSGLWECLIGCRRRLDQHMARRRVKI